MGEEALRFYLLEADYKVINDKAVIHLYGRTMDGKQVCVLDESFEPYFWVINEDGAQEQIKSLRIMHNEREVSVARTEFHQKNFLGKRVDAIKVYAKLPSDVPVLRESISAQYLEADIPFARKYLIDKGITPLCLCEAKGEFVGSRLRVPAFRAESIEQAGDDVIKPKVLAFDIETHSPAEIPAPDRDPIAMLGFYGENFQKVITWKRFKTSLDYVEFVESEAELIKRFGEIIDEQKPDILCGYFSDGFDLPYIRARAEKYRINLDIGLDYSGIRINKGRGAPAAITGIIHLDIYGFIRRIMGPTLETATYDLDSVASELVNDGKEKASFDEFRDAWEKSSDRLDAFCSYNLKDALLTYKLSEKILPNITELVKLTGSGLFDVSRMSFSQLVESYLSTQAKRFNELIPNKPGYEESRKRRLQSYTGAFVYEPKPGLYKDVIVFDFRSLYPSIISAHNISPDTLNCECCPDLEPAPGEQGRFCKKRKGFISAVIEDLINRRMRIKEMMREKKDKMLDARQYALKTVANAMYGYMGFFAARWYCLECVKSITAYGRSYITGVIEKAKKSFNVLYADSLPYERNVFIKFGNGDIKLIKIGKLYDRYRQESGLSTLALGTDGRVAFKPVTRVIRHPYKGKLVSIKTRYGSTIVTPQHAVYSFDYDTNKICLVDAKKLKSGDKLISLTNPQLAVTYKKNHSFDIADLDLAEFSEELCLYCDNNDFPAKNGICPYCKKRAFLSSHVSSKHAERRHKLDRKSTYRWVGSLHGKGKRIPRYWKLNEDLAWLLGFYCAEGSVTDVTTRSGRKTAVSFGSQNRKLIEKVKLILCKKLGCGQKIIKNYDHRTNRAMFYYRIPGLPAVALLQRGFCAGKGSEFKKVPWFIFTAEEALRRAFVRGYLDGDGNTAKDKRYATHFIRFSTKSRELACGLDFLLKSLKHKPNSRGKEVKHIAWLYRADKPKISSLRLQSAKESQRNFCLAEIKSIRNSPGQKHVYDLEVEGVHNFVDAEGMILVHNTDSIFLTLGGKIKEDAERFVDAINMDLPGMMELEYEGMYPAGIFVSLKEKGTGAKKKYALLTQEGTMKIRGFETVRRNLSAVAKETQEAVLNIVLKENDVKKAEEYIKGVVAKLKNREIPVEKVIISTQLQKEITSYDAIGPHVAIAQRMKNAGKVIGAGSQIKYVVVEGKDRIRDRARLPEEVEGNSYDAEYYINNQVIPAVGKIFEVLGVDINGLLESKEQSKLDRFV